MSCGCSEASDAHINCPTLTGEPTRPDPATTPAPPCENVLVRYAGPDPLDEHTFAAGSALSAAVSSAGWSVLRHGVGSMSDVLVLKAPAGFSAPPGVLSQTPAGLPASLQNFEHSLLWQPRTRLPNDPLLGLQRVALEETNALQAWERITKIPIDPPVVVAVVDTGIHYTHEDLVAELWGGNLQHGWNFSGGAGEDTDDVAGHGTAVAGVIAARSDNHKGVASIAWHGRIQLAIARYAKTLAGGCTEDLIEAINYAAQLPASVINLSVGQSQYSFYLQQALLKIASEHPKTLIVAAVANEALNLEASHPPVQDYPASYLLPNVIAVQAATTEGGLQRSAYGSLTVHIAAPGVEICSTGVGKEPYVSGAGTSLAAPQVSATAALMSGYAPEWSQQQIRQFLVDSARNPVCALPGVTADPFSLCGKSQSGGILNVDAATGAPALIDSPSEGAHWRVGAAHSLTWHRLFSTSLCPQLDPILSVDDGEHWQLLGPHSTLWTRDARAEVTLPENTRPTAKARMGLRCHDTARLERWSAPFEIFR